MKPPTTVLVVITRRIGDVLLATPLVRSLKSAWPDTSVDLLVFGGTEGILEHNPDVRRVLAVPERPGWRDHLGLLRSIFRRYDIALSAVPGDRPTLYAWLAGKWRAGLVIDEPQHAWKKFVLNRWVAFDGLNTHTVRAHLALATLLGIPRRFEVVAKWCQADERRVSGLLAAAGQNYAVLHPFPKFNYKMWHEQGWLECAAWLAQRGLRVVLTGGGDALEKAYVGALAAKIPAALNLAGELSLCQTARLLSRARLCVGPDTVITHLAAGFGIPTVALFGPTDPVKWGPWPKNHVRDENPWTRLGSQIHGNVALVQGAGACVPCRLEGCGRRIESFSDCLQQLPAQRVIQAAERLLATLHPAAHD